MNNNVDSFSDLFRSEVKVCCENCKFLTGYCYCKLQNGKNIGSPRSHKCKKFIQNGSL